VTVTSAPDSVRRFAAPTPLRARPKTRILLPFISTRLLFISVGMIRSIVFGTLAGLDGFCLLCVELGEDTLFLESFYQPSELDIHIADHIQDRLLEEELVPPADELILGFVLASLRWLIYTLM
jgi:hypothetical protein